MSFAERFKSFVVSKWMLIVGALVVVVVGGIAMGVRSYLTAASGGLFGWLAASIGAVSLGAVWYVLRSSQSASSQGAGSELQIAAQRSPQEFNHKLLRSLKTLKASPRQGRGESAYTLPWILMLGAPQSGKTTLLSAAEMNPIDPSQPAGGTVNFDWWVSNSLVVLDTAGRYGVPENLERDSQEWDQLIRQTRNYHTPYPFNAAVVTISADSLSTQTPDALRIQGEKLRVRIDQAVKRLKTNFPLYIVVTKCDLIDGFREFFLSLPTRIRRDAIGWIDDPSATSNASEDAPKRRGMGVVDRLQMGIESVFQRLHLLRLSILGGRLTHDLRQPIYCFPEEFKALEAPLLSFAKPLLADDVRFDTPLFRGIFFVSARQEGIPASSLRRDLQIGGQPSAQDGKQQSAFFLHDLFEVIFPRDRELCSASQQGGRNN